MCTTAAKIPECQFITWDKPPGKTLCLTCDSSVQCSAIPTADSKGGSGYVSLREG